MKAISRPRVQAPSPARGSLGIREGEDLGAGNAFESEFLEEESGDRETTALDAAAAWDSDTLPPPGEEDGAPDVVTESATEIEDSPEEEAELASSAEEEAEVDESAEAEEEGPEAEAEDEGAAEAEEAVAAIEEAAAEPSPCPGPGVTTAPAVNNAAVAGGRRVAPEPSPEPFIHELYEARTGMKPDQHAAMANAALANLDAGLASGATDVEAHANQLTSQIDAAIEGRVASLWASFEGASANLSAGFTTARAHVEGFAATALANIDAAAAGALSQIEALETSQVDAIAQGFDAEVARLGTMGDAAVSSFTAAFDAQVQAIRDTGESRAQEALSTGQSRAAAYRGRGGDGIEAKRNSARADAALRVAQDYAVGLRDKANEVANEVAQGSGNIPSIVSQLIEPVVEQLSTAQADAEEGVRAAAESSREQVEEQRDVAVEAMEETREQALTTLDSQEVASLEDLRGVAQTFEDNLRNAGESLKEQILKAAGELGSRYAEGAAAIQATLGAGDMPDGPEVQQACQELLAQFEAEKTSHLLELSSAALSGLADLDAELASAQSGLQQAADQAVCQADTMANELGEGLLQGAEDFSVGLDELYTTVETNLTEMVTGALDGARACVDDTGSALTEQESVISTELGTVVTNVDSSLGEALGKLPADIEKEAEAAASKIQPWWKKAIAAVVSIVVAIVVAIAVTAFCIVTLGTGAIVAGIIAGAVAGIAATFASDATMSLLTWSNQFSSWKTYLAAGLTGAVMGGVGAWVGPMLSGASMTTKIAAGTGMSFLGSSIDQVFDMTLYGESWNWGEWFLGGTVGAVLGGLATRFVPSSLGESMRKSLFSRGGPNSWNNFQRAFARVPGLSGSTPTQRAQIYRMVASKLGDVPEKLVDKTIGILGWTSDPDKKTPDPEDYEGDGSRVQIADIAVPAF